MQSTARRLALPGWLVLAALGWASGCGNSQQPPAAAPKPEPLRVASASDLQTALPVLAARFTKKSGVEVSPTFGASGQLAEQIKAAAPFDVFLSANRSFVEDLAKDGAVVPESVSTYAFGSLVLAVHPDSGASIHALTDLSSSPDIKRIAIANPAFAPYGVAGKQALERSEVWKKVEPKIVQTESVRQALQFVETGNAEAALVGKSIASASRKVRLIEIDRALYKPIVQGLGIVTRTKRLPDAQKFVDFLLSVEGQNGFAEFGFSMVKPAP